MSTDTMVVKEVSAFEIKDEAKGEVEAVIATLGVIDRDGDIIKEGAIKSGAKVKMSGYGHDAVWGETPVGKGAIHVEGDKAVFKGKLFLTTERGREIFSVLKEMGSDQEWSFGFQVKGSEQPDEDTRKQGAWRILTKLDAFEVSPVLRGAGIGTHTVAVKEAELDREMADLKKTVAENDEAIAAKRAEIEEEDRKRAEAKEAETKAAALLAANVATADEFERFQRTRRRLG